MLDKRSAPPDSEAAAWEKLALELVGVDPAAGESIGGPPAGQKHLLSKQDGIEEIRVDQRLKTLTPDTEPGPVNHLSPPQPG